MLRLVLNALMIPVFSPKTKQASSNTVTSGIIETALPESSQTISTKIIAYKLHLKWKESHA